MNTFSQYIAAICSFYEPVYLGSLVLLLQRSDYKVGRYLKTYWTMQNFSGLAAERPTPTSRNRALMLFVFLGAVLQMMVAIAMLVFATHTDMAGATAYGLALLVSYPIVWAHLLALGYAVFKILWAFGHPKVVGRAFVCAILENQVVRLRLKHKFIVIAVAGSIGKTSTKLAIAHTLEPTRRVIYQSGNYNDRVTIPLVLFGQGLPNLLNVFAWCKVFIRNEQTISRPNFYDIAVVELGTDRPGDMAHFGYLKPDISVVTALTAEHMESFKTLAAVAAEELTVCDYSKQILVNADDADPKYLKGRQTLTYGTAKKPDFKASNYKSHGLNGGSVKLQLQDSMMFEAQASILGEQGVKILLAAAAAAQLAGLSRREIQKGLIEVKPFAGRMQLLKGVKGSTIIDDTYNASPEPVKAGLDVLYASEASQRIAILGSMNELGDYSPEAHTEVGSYCQPRKLAVVVTIGADAEKYLAPVARARGCKVKSFKSPYEAGNYVLSMLKKGALVLAEGSQNGVFAEESLKVLLAEPKDAAKLVRQSKYWMNMKDRQFSA